MQRFALIGEKLAHSASVPIHREIWRQLGISADYRLVEIPRDEFIPRVRQLMGEVDGFNITIPYKQAIMPLLSSIDPVAQAMGAVNTVLCGDDCRGYNTDAPGLMAMLRHHDIDPVEQKAYILGTGGASKAARYALEAMGAASVTFVSRTPHDDVIGYDALADTGSGLIVNCTPAGMYPHTDGCPLTPAQLARLLPRVTGVADTIYNPPETVLTAAAHSAGIPACTGLYMLVDQAVEAERRWFPDIDIPADMTARVLKELKLF